MIPVDKNLNPQLNSNENACNCGCTIISNAKIFKHFWNIFSRFTEPSAGGPSVSNFPLKKCWFKSLWGKQWNNLYQLHFLKYYFNSLWSKKFCTNLFVVPFHSFLVNFFRYSFAGCGWTMWKNGNWSDGFCDICKCTIENSFLIWISRSF